MSKSKLLHLVLLVALLCGVSALPAASVTTTVLHDTFAASAVNAGLLPDANGYRAPTANQALWFGGGAAVVYTQNTSVGTSAGNRGLLAYFQPSTSLATLGEGETLTATVTFKFTGGTGASSTGDFRVALLNSGGNGTATNGIGSPPAGARIVTDNFSLTSGGDTPRGYSGYLIDSTASPTPSTNSLSFWRRDGAAGRSQQWLGPTSGGLAANTAFNQLLPGAGGGPAGAIVNDGTLYVATFSVTLLSANNVALAYSVTKGGTTVMSYSVTESTDAPHVGFDTFMVLSMYNAAFAVTDFLITKTSASLGFLTQPKPQEASPGQSVTFEAIATGAPAPTYQWQKNGVNIPGATSRSLTIGSIQASDAGTYRVIASNVQGVVTSDEVTLSVLTVPEITAQGVEKIIIEGQNATLTVGVRGAAPLAYQWKKDGVNVSDGGVIAGATTATLTATAARVGDGGLYTLVVTNSYGSVTSDPVALTVYPATPPVIDAQPGSQTVIEGADVSFTVGVSGPPPYSFHWSQDGVDLVDNGRITGTQTAKITFGSVRLSDSGRYFLAVTNLAGRVSSSAATLTVNPAPTPSAPAANLPRNVVETQFSAQWTRATNATGYRFDVATDAGFTHFVYGYENVDAGAALSAIVTGLVLDTTYYYRVRAYNSSGTSGHSNVISVKVQPPVAPKITSVNGTSFTSGVPGAFTVTATGVPAPLFAATGLPSWATLDAISGVLSGTPPAGETAVKSVAVALTAKNDRSPDATQAFTLTIRPIPAIAEPLTVSTLAGTAGSGGSTDAQGAAARFKLLAGIGADAGGMIYVADTGNHTVRKITAAGAVTTLAGSAGISGSANGTGTAATFNTPTGIAVDGAGNVYVADTLNHTIRKVTGAGVVTTLAGQTGKSGSADGIGAAAQFFAPQGLAVDATNTALYVADTNNDTIRKIMLATGTVTTVAGTAGQAGSADGTGSAARFNGPSDVALDKNGNLYVADTESGTIRTISPSGAVSTLAGLAASSGATDGAGDAARFNHPSALAVDGAFNVYVLDTDNHTLRKIVSALGVVTTLGGQPGASGGADGIGSVARFKFPAGIAVGASGDLYIADTNNHTVRLGALPNKPVIETQPQSRSAIVGEAVQFSVKATGRPAPTYQWYLNGGVISGATADTLSVSSVQAVNAGDYTVVVTNAMGSVTSNRAGLVVNPVAVPAVGMPGGGGGAPGAWFYLALALLGGARWAFRTRGRHPSNS